MRFLLLLFVLATQCRELWQEIYTNELLHNTNFDIAKSKIEYWESKLYTSKNKTYNNNIFCSCSRQFVKMLKYSDAFYNSFAKYENSFSDFQTEYCKDVTCSSESRVLTFKCTDHEGVIAYAYQKIDQPLRELKTDKKIQIDIIASPQNADEVQFFRQLNNVVISINYYSFPFINYTSMVKQGNSYKFTYDINVTDVISTPFASNNSPKNHIQLIDELTQQDNSITHKPDIFRIYYIESQESYCGNMTNRPTLLISHISLYIKGKYGKIEPWVISISALGVTSCICASCIFICKILFRAKKDEEELSSYQSIV